jgi:hypothetical protein
MTPRDAGLLIEWAKIEYEEERSKLIIEGVY